MSLYKLTDEMERLMEDENADEQALERVFVDIQASAERACQFLAVLDADIDAFKAEEKRLADRRKALEGKKERMKTYVRENMQRLMIDKLKAGTFTVSLQDSPPSVVVHEETAIPARFFIIIPETKQLDKKAVLAALKNKEIVPGAYLEHGQHIRVR